MFGSFLTMKSSATEASDFTSQCDWHKCKRVWANFSNNCLALRDLSKEQFLVNSTSVSAFDVIT